MPVNLILHPQNIYWYRRIKRQRKICFNAPSFPIGPSSSAPSHDSCLYQPQLEPGTKISPIDALDAIFEFLTHLTLLTIKAILALFQLQLKPQTRMIRNWFLGHSGHPHVHPDHGPDHYDHLRWVHGENFWSSSLRSWWCWSVPLCNQLRQEEGIGEPLEPPDHNHDGGNVNDNGNDGNHDMDASCVFWWEFWPRVFWMFLMTSPWRQ